MITVSTILPFVGLLAAVVALENVRFANSPANSARLGAEPTKADLWPAAPTMPPHLRFAAIPLKPRDSSQNCGYFETDTPASTVPSESRTAPSDSNTAAPAPSPQTENAPPIGAIVGGAIAGLVVMGLIVTAIVWMILRNRRKASKDNDNNGGPAGTNQPYTYATVPATRATSEWQSSTPAPMYEPYKSNRQSGNSGPYQHQSTTPSQSPDPTSRSGALPNDYSPNRVSEVPATNPAGTGNNASELHSDHVQRT
ncbi:hypothetical protein HER10_EVM0008800 [Colletotrichum scovillei]|uniref:uncharacterized protein n=1 Tax=Colletotrichum scovillei TaxID=1209932 RepID=UPI0015C33832|nr:uncharacterized protein HER10_EVM0008800 [Colletotrichum scovillei]KAF4772943.1 hypothetical protein HER10_EVM0008800 [Colletotrichum scovillei]